ncbi:hypothetical protein EC973_003764 [Apophysomyces ossiformis]|uniref:Chromo domain-containing protein n=1 Tax=Apophysomyces ossiformis TaxID=679940 RepID=A0A8H7BFD1_9FUNG|nr:hypothetical protein EC973_003764 [Apophysomyces ossiformis]
MKREGPFTVVHKIKGDSYVLRDEQGVLLPIDIPPSQLKLISQDEIVPADQVYEVENIVAHEETENGQYRYKVRWKNYPPEQDTWEPYENFTDASTVAAYWERLGQAQPHADLNTGIKRKRATKINTQVKKTKST